MSMELGRLVQVESSWDASESLQVILLITNRIDTSCLSVLDTPTSTPCFIHINCQKLKGYYPVGIRLTSGSRTVECYTGMDEEYVGTARGTLVDRDHKLYQCEFELPNDVILQEVHLKLLSLQGSSEVSVSNLCLAVVEDIGGKAVEMPTSNRHTLPHTSDMRELIGSLPVSGAPPLLQNLASSLQLLQCSSSEMPSHEDMSKIVSLFKQLRPSQSMGPTSTEVETTPTTTATSDGDGIDERLEANGSVSDSNGKMESDTIALLERRLQEYIDRKFLLLQKQMEENFDKLRRELLRVKQ